VGLLTGLLTLPAAPLRGVIAVANQVKEQAESEYYDPARIRVELDEVARLRDRGELTDDEAVAWEDALIERLMISNQRAREERHG
jgi:hypothetical protein